MQMHKYGIYYTSEEALTHKVKILFITLKKKTKDGWEDCSVREGLIA